MERPDPKRWLALALLCAAQFIVILDTSIIGVAGAAIVAAAQAKRLTLSPVQNFSAQPGFGISGDVGGRNVQVGADRAMAKLGLDVSVFSGSAARLGDEGKSPLYAAIDGRLVAIIAVADPTKDSATVPPDRDRPRASALLARATFRCRSASVRRRPWPPAPPPA